MGRRARGGVFDVMMRTIVLAALAVCACEKAPFTQPLTLGGRVVTAATLTAGRDAYSLYCRACHGDKGDGQGPAAPSLRPPPRDFTLGRFKFAAVASGQLPNDDDLRRIVRGGLTGTAMLAWDVPEPELTNAIQYVKTFSPRWRDEEPGVPILPKRDPFGPARAAEAVALGKKVYHGLAQCWTCHPAYATRSEMTFAARELRHVEIVDLRGDLYAPVLKDSEYHVKILPPDFTRMPLRSVRPGHELEDLYRVIGAGVGGTAMPQWQGQLPEEQLWAMAY
jgi:mono/diheme cytochrome c family protein